MYKVVNQKRKKWWVKMPNQRGTRHSNENDISWPCSPCLHHSWSQYTEVPAPLPGPWSSPSFRFQQVQPAHRRASWTVPGSVWGRCGQWAAWWPVVHWVPCTRSRIRTRPYTAVSPARPCPCPSRTATGSPIQTHAGPECYRTNKTL